MYNLIRLIWILLKWVYYATAAFIIVFVMLHELGWFSYTSIGLTSIIIGKYNHHIHENTYMHYISYLLKINSYLDKNENLLKCYIYFMVGIGLILTISYVTGFWKLFVKLIWSRHARDFLDREQVKLGVLNECLKEVINTNNEINKHKNESAGNFRIKLFNSDAANVWVYTDKTIVITQGFYDKYKDNKDAIKGVLAHELGHVINTDLFINEVNLAAETTTYLWSTWLIFMKNYFSIKVLLFFNFIERVTSRFALLNIIFLPMCFVYLIFIISFLLPTFFVFLFMNLIQGIIIDPINMYLSRRSEFKADLYALELGYGKGLLDFLYDDLNSNKEKFSILKWIYSSHPNSYKRIKRLERKYRINNQI